MSLYLRNVWLPCKMYVSWFKMSISWKSFLTVNLCLKNTNPFHKSASLEEVWSFCFCFDTFLSSKIFRKNVMPLNAYPMETNLFWKTFWVDRSASGYWYSTDRQTDEELDDLKVEGRLGWKQYFLLSRPAIEERCQSCLRVVDCCHLSSSKLRYVRHI